MGNFAVQPARMIFPSGRMRERQQINVRPVVSGITHLAAGEERLHHQCTAECHHLIRVRSSRQTVIHQFRDEPRNAEQFRRCGSRIGGLHRGLIARFVFFARDADQHARQIDVRILRCGRITGLLERSAHVVDSKCLFRRFAMPATPGDDQTGHFLVSPATQHGDRRQTQVVSTG